MAKRKKDYSGWEKEELIAHINKLEKRKKYGLVWDEETTKEKFEKDVEGKLPVLNEISEKSIKYDSNKPAHILIEGDNYHALSVLNYTHEKAIDVIYIDPPYNRGSNDFRYNDKWVDVEDGYRHSKWLSFMSKRLKIARELLKETGVIFISIDDNEVAQLKLLCDDIFNGNKTNPKDSNLLGTLIWDLGTGTSAGHFTRSHEYILCYAKEKKLLPNFVGGEGEIDDRAVKKISKKNPESEFTFPKGTKFLAEDDSELSDYWGGTERITLVSGEMKCKNQQLKADVTLKAGWTQKRQMELWFDEQETVDSKGQKVIEFYFRSNGKIYCRKNREKINPPTILRDIASTKSGSSALKDFFNGEDKFDFPKPPQLIKELLRYFSNDVLVLDFFAGTGTTAQSVLEMNADDNGQRQVLLCTNNENEICEEVTYPRFSKVIIGYTNTKNKEIEGIKENLIFYHTSFVPGEPTDHNKEILTKQSVEMLCLRENTFEQVSESEEIKIFENTQKFTAILFNEDKIEELKEAIWNLQKPINIYIFSLGDEDYSEEFVEFRERVKLCSIPEAILRIYRRIFK